MQRGATNVTISETTTALDIPEPNGNGQDAAADIRQHRNFADVSSAPDGPRAPVLIGLIAEDLGVSEDLVRRVAADPQGEPAAEVRTNLLSDEWAAFRQVFEDPETDASTPDFVVSSASLTEDTAVGAVGTLSDRIRHVVLAHRLREVRVQQGFRRYDPSADLVDVDLGVHGRARWLPAVESFGEGVFLALDPDRLRDWESRTEVVRRADQLEGRRQHSQLSSRLAVATPRLVLVHTFSHLLMRRLAFSSGYASASLRERVYAGNQDEAGVLIYTASGDAEGTLGGLVRQGEPPRLARTVLAALETADWCSADPVCRESHGQGLGNLNLAGCHGCCLVAETSCERANVLLDRVLVVGDDTVEGFFTPVVSEIRAATVGRA